MLNEQKIKGLFNRVLNASTTTEQDERDIKDYITKVFGDGSVTPDPSMLHQFNTLIVQKADEIAKPKATEILSMLATFQTSALGKLVKYDIPVKNKAKVVWAAQGTGVDLVRVGGQKSKIATPQKFQTGVYYEPLDLVERSVEAFRDVVANVADAKIKLYFDVISRLTKAAINSSEIPAANVKVGNNLTLVDYNKVGSTLARYGGRPIFVADTLLIDHFAMQQATDTTYKNLLSDKIKEELLTALNPATVGRTTAVNLINPFTDENNNKTELPVNVGYMFAGGVKQKPFYIVEYGGLKQFTEQDAEDERIKLKLTLEAAIELAFGQAIGYIEEQSAVAL